MMENQLAKLENLFDSQITTLIERGTPMEIVEILIHQHDSVIQKASKITLWNEHIPFLPIIPRTYRSLYDLMSAVFHNGNVGCSFMEPTIITDKIKTPGNPYYIYNVEEGILTENKNLKITKKTFRFYELSPLTVAEVLALITHADTLSRRGIWAVGSQYDSDNEVPNVSIVRNSPRLSRGNFDIIPKFNFGSPSCNSRG